jgi:hypothetical protein
MFNRKKKIVTWLIGIVALLTITGCSDASIASSNLSTAADNFELERRVVFYNGITNEYILTIQGRCSVKTVSNQLSVTCKTGVNQYKKHYLGLSDNVTYFSEQLEAVSINTYHYRVIFKPAAIIPFVESK